MLKLPELSFLASIRSSIECGISIMSSSKMTRFLQRLKRGGRTQTHDELGGEVGSSFAARAHTLLHIDFDCGTAFYH